MSICTVQNRQKFWNHGKFFPKHLCLVFPEYFYSVFSKHSIYVEFEICLVYFYIMWNKFLKVFSEQSAGNRREFSFLNTR